MQKNAMIKRVNVEDVNLAVTYLTDLWELVAGISETVSVTIITVSF
jgi:hypothetical protein